jgi:hypothetical protein
MGRILYAIGYEGAEISQFLRTLRGSRQRDPRHLVHRAPIEILVPAG